MAEWQGAGASVPVSPSYQDHTNTKISLSVKPFTWRGFLSHSEPPLTAAGYVLATQLSSFFVQRCSEIVLSQRDVY